MERHKALHCDKTYEKHACIDAESNELYCGEVLDIIDTRGDSDNRLFLVYWGQEIKGCKKYLIKQEFESDKCQKSTEVIDEYEVEFVTDCNVVKWKDYIIDGSNPQGTPNTTVQSVRNLKDTTAFKRLQGIPKTSKDSKCNIFQNQCCSQISSKQ